MPFFNKLRKAEIKTDGMNRYLLYAIGEILLVMIGILLALEVSNWNDERKEEKLELSLLAEMVENLKYDSTDMEGNIRIQQRAINGAEIILARFEAGTPYHDSLKKHFVMVGIVPVVLLSKTAYTSLSREGMRIVKNDSLRKAISAKYETHYKFIERFNENEFNSVFGHHREINEKYFHKFRFFKNLEPVDYEKLRKEQVYINYLEIRLGFLHTSIDLYKEHIASNREFISAIERELKKRGYKLRADSK